MIRKSIIKIASILLIIGLNWTGLSAVIETFAYFNDTEDSLENTFSATTLDFSLNSLSDFSPSAIVPGESATRDVAFINDGNIPQYTVEANSFSGPLCEYLNLEANLDGESPEYTGSLIGFSYGPIVFADPENWSFTLTLPVEAPETVQGETCQFKFIFNGWQDNLPTPIQGFNDSEEIINNLTAGKWIIYSGDIVINELMWMGSYKKSKDEWIELRNTTNFPIDISSWQLTKLIGGGAGKKEKLMLEIPSGNIIPPNEFFLISKFDKDKSAINVDPDLVDKKVNLRNKNLQIKLYKGNWQDPGNLIDIADDGIGKPLAGLHGKLFHFSMERNDFPGDGTLAENWHTTFDDSPEMRAYWDPLFVDDASINRGTPGGRNLSENDNLLMEYYQQLEEYLLVEGKVLPDLISDEEDYDEEDLFEETIFNENIEEEEIINLPGTGSIETVAPEEDEINLQTQEEIVIEETITEDTEEQPVIEEPVTDEETTEGIITDEDAESGGTDEAPVDEVSVVEEQPATLPDESASNPDGSGENASSGGSGDGGSDTSGSLDSSNQAEGAGESSGDSGVDAGGESVSE